MEDASLTPHLRSPHVRVTSPAGLALYAARCGWRYFVTGRELHGHGDNATWLHDATVDYRKRPYEKLTRARWRRVARRWTLLGVPGCLEATDLSAWLVRHGADALGAGHPGWTDVPWDGLLGSYMVAMPLAAGAVAYPKAKRAWQMRAPSRDYIQPAAKVACQILGVAYHRRDAQRMIDLPPGYEPPASGDKKADSVRVFLPPVPLDDRTKKRLVSNVGARLGMPGATGQWQEVGGRAFVDLLPGKLPPADVKLDDLMGAIMAAPITRPVLGLASGREPFHLDLDNDSPHIAVSAGSGAGKSTLWRLYLAQRGRHGAGIIYLDIKSWSAEFLHGMDPDRVLYMDEVAGIHEACVAVGDEIMRRKRLRSRAELDRLRELDVVVEEANSIKGILTDYWRELRGAADPQERAGMPMISPALQALKYGINMGREFRVHFHFLGQSLDANTFPGGRNSRASFRSKILSQYTRNDWNMLVNGLPYVPCPDGPKGIWTHAAGNTVDVFRIPVLSNGQARDLMMSGQTPTVPILPGQNGEYVRTLARNAAGQIEVERVQLSEAVRRLPVAPGRDPMSLDALRTQSKRDTQFPAPLEAPGPGKASVYDMRELIEWKARKDSIPLALVD